MGGSAQSQLAASPIRLERIALFYGAAMVGSVLSGLASYKAKSSGAKALTLIMMMFTPVTAAAITQKSCGEPLLGAVGARWDNLFSRWGLAAAAFPVILGGLSTVVSLAVPGVRYAPGEALRAKLTEAGASEDEIGEVDRSLAGSPPSLVARLLAQSVIAGGTVNLLPAFGEEAGWRGLLLRELAPLGFWRASLLSGAMWGVWHAPVVLQGHNYPQHPVAGVAMMTAFCTLLSPPMTLVRWNTGSVWSCAVFHGVLNAVGGLPQALLAGGDDLTTGITGATGLAALCCLDAAIATWLPMGARPASLDTIPARQGRGS